MDGGPGGMAADRGETSLVERARRGDRSAFETIVDDRIEATFREVLAILGDETAALDTTRTTFVRTWRELPRLRQPARFPAWFERIVADSCRLSGRTKAARQRQGEAHSGSRVREIQVVPVSVDPRESTTTATARPASWDDPDLVGRALDRLPVPTRTLLYLHYRARLSLDATSARLGLPARTVWSRLFDARRALIRALKAELSADPGDRLTDEAIASAFERRASRQYPRGLRLEVSAEIGTTPQLRSWGRLAALRSPVARRLAAATVVLVGLVALVGVGISQVPPASVEPSSAPIARAVRAGLLAFIRDGDVYLSDADGGAAAVALHADGVPFRTVSWAPDGKRIAAGTDEAVFVLDPSDLTVRRLATGTLAAWSPDGKRIAVIDPNAEQPDGSNTIKIVRVADGGTVLEIRTPIQSSMPQSMAWSPDDRWLVGQGRGHLLRFDVRSGLVAEIAALSEGNDSPASPTWSPDSRRLAYIDSRSSDGGGCGRRSCHGQLTIIDPDGGNISQPMADQPNQSQPAWSPDGRSIAFLSSGDLVGQDDALSVYDLEARHSQQVADGPIADFAWNPDGRSVGFERRLDTDLGSSWTLGSVPIVASLDRSEVAGQETVLVADRPDSGFAWQAMPATSSDTHAPEPAGSPAVAASPEPARPPENGKPAQAKRSGSALVFDSNVNDCIEADRAPLDGGETTVVRSMCGLNFNYGQWSPDGSMYAALIDDHLELTTRAGITQSSLGGLTGIDSFSWSPDGRRLVVHRCPNGPTCVWQILRPDGTHGEELTGEPVWSQDGRHRLVRMPDGTAVLSDGDGQASTTLPQPLPIGATLGPDGAMVAFVKDGDAWVEGVGEEQARNLTNFEFGGANSPTWSPDGRSIAVARNGELWVVPLAGGSPRKVIDIRNAGIGTARWSPDGARLAVEVWMPPGNDAAVWIVSSDGSPTVALGGGQTPLWSADGRILAFARTANGITDGIDIANADGTGRTQVWTGPGNNIPQAWVP